MAVRLTHTARPVTIVAAYGKVAARRDEADEEWDEVLGQFSLAKARGDLAVCVGDLNRLVGDVIPGNRPDVTYGGQAIRDELQVGNMVLLNGLQGKVVGGPMTWFLSLIHI